MTFELDCKYLIMSESDSQTKAELQSEFKVPSAALGRRKKQEGIQKARERGEEHPVVTEQERHVETTEAKVHSLCYIFINTRRG